MDFARIHLTWNGVNPLTLARQASGIKPPARIVDQSDMRFLAFILIGFSAAYPARSVHAADENLGTVSKAQCIQETLSSIVRSQQVGARFLHSKNPNLHNTPEVNSAADQFGLSVNAKPTDKLSIWLHQMENSFSHAGQPGNEIEREKIRKYYHDLFLTRPESVPESFFNLQKKIARERGHGGIQLTAAIRKQLVEHPLNEQTQSLDQWIDYFLSPDSGSYPVWTKYWVLTSLGKLGKFDPETATFANRSKGTMSIFPELNREAFAQVVDVLVKKAHGHSLEDIQDPKLLSLLDVGSFAKLYGYALREARSKVVDRTSTDGKWVVYKQGNDHWPLVNSLQGMQTGWCTAGEATARSQLSRGDFHVFYTQDQNGEYRIPRIAIRMERNSIAEVRGVAKDQARHVKAADLAGENPANKGGAIHVVANIA